MNRTSRRPGRQCRLLLVALSLIANFGHLAWSDTARGKSAVTSSRIAGVVTAIQEGEYLTVRTEEEREQTVMITEGTRFLDAGGKAMRDAAIVEGSTVRIRTSGSHGKWLALEITLKDSSAKP